MKHLEFPVSAAAVHLHGREFHDQDYFESVSAPLDETAPGSAAETGTAVPAVAREPPQVSRVVRVVRVVMARVSVLWRRE